MMKGFGSLKEPEGKIMGQSLACLHVELTNDFPAGASEEKSACAHCLLWVFVVEATCWKWYVTGFFFTFQTFSLFRGYGGFHP